MSTAGVSRALPSIRVEINVHFSCESVWVNEFILTSGDTAKSGLGPARGFVQNSEI